MQLNVLDDLAEAMKALDGKKSKTTEIDRAVIPSEVVGLEPYPSQFLKFGHVPPHPAK